MTAVTITTGLQRAARLIPFHTGNAGSRLRGDYGAVCSHPGEVPEQIRDAQIRRRDTYMLTGARNMPDDAPRYFVTSYGVLIAWVTLDGRTHYASGWHGFTDAERRTMVRHRDAIRASWPERFAMNSEGDPISIRDESGGWSWAPAGSREVTDADGYRRVILPDAIPD